MKVIAIKTFLKNHMNKLISKDSNWKPGDT